MLGARLWLAIYLILPEALMTFNTTPKLSSFCFYELMWFFSKLEFIYVTEFTTTDVTNLYYTKLYELFCCQCYAWSNQICHFKTPVGSCYISIGLCKKDITALLTHWNYVFLTLTQQYTIWFCHKITLIPHHSHSISAPLLTAQSHQVKWRCWINHPSVKTRSRHINHERFIIVTAAIAENAVIYQK